MKIDGGVADPFKVDIAGSGDVRFGGTANNPDVSVMGSGDVWIAARLPLSYWCSGFGYSLNSVGHGSS